MSEAGRSRAKEVAHLISTPPVQVVPADLELSKQAAEFKSKHRMSYAHSFAVELAKQRKAELVTGDKDLREVEKKIKIL